METITLPSWSEFDKTVRYIREKYGTLERFGSSRRNVILFRGQKNSLWNLQTTLERYQQVSPLKWNIKKYVNLALDCSIELVSFTGYDWNLPTKEDLNEEITRRQDEFRPYLPIRTYQYLVYLRQHGFPSPLLDWTESPYIAAFFALAEPVAADVKYSSIFVYVETPRGMKSGWVGNDTITVWKKKVKTHKRHFQQQAWYTTATQWCSGDHNFVSHENVFQKDSKRQDLLIKIDIPRSERMRVLTELDEHNLNHFSLFQTEEALAKTLAFREIDKVEHIVNGC